MISKKFNIVITLIILAIVGGYVWYGSLDGNNGPTVCTLEALICPDGTAVGRTGPQCEFAVCGEVDSAYNTLILGGKKITIEIADSPEERQQGLSDRIALTEDTGMLFVFETSDFQHFWMKDTLIPLDILWINANKEIVHIEKNVTPDTFPQTFTSTLPARYVLEVNSGFSKKHKIQEGEAVKFEL
jgi:uncharacterized membrane protein (UPF0127 family)